MKRLTTSVAVAVGLFAVAGGAAAASFTDFESFTTGVSVDGQDGWKATGTWDEEVVDLGGNNAWRISNETTSGSFGDQPFAKPSGEIAGETGSTYMPAPGDSVVTNRFIASFDIWSVTGAAQVGLDVTVSPDDGQGSRQSFLSIEDNGSGIDIDFFDTDANHATTNPNGGFRFTQAALGLAYDQVHTIMFDITFVDGNIIDGDGTVHGNDIVKIFVDGALAVTGTTWESYFWTTTEGQTPPSVRAIDTLLFRLSTDNSFVSNGGGYYIDNVSISSVVPIPAAVWLFGSGLLGLIGIARRKKAA